MRSSHLLALAVSSVLAVATAPLLADADGAKGYLKEAIESIGNNDFDTATAKLELAETELDGLEPTAKAPLADQIKQARAKITFAQAAADRPMYKRKLERAMDDAEGAIGNLVIWGGAERELTELLANPKLRAALPDEAAAAEKKFATFKKLNAKKSAVQITAQIEENVKQIEAQWVEDKPKFKDPDESSTSKDRVIERLGDSIKTAREQIAKLDADDPAAKAFVARLDKVSTDFTEVALADKAKEVAARLTENTHLYDNEHEGWEKETKSPTWAEFQGQSGGDMDAFNSPKTIAFVSRTDGLIESLKENEEYQLVASAPAVKSVVDGVKAKRAQAYATLLKRVQTVADAALAAPATDPDKLSRLKDSVRLALGETSPEGLAYQEKIQKRMDGATAAAAGAEDAKTQLVDTLRKKADEAWPALQAGLTPVDEIDLTKAGTTIKFTSDNLSGYRFKPSDFYFTTTLGGEPVAAKLDPKMLAGIKAIESKIGRSIGDDDNDGKWEVFAVITAKKTKLLARKQVDATATVEGTDVKITGEYADPVEATIIEIVAAKCGPFAGAKDKGVLTPDGSLAR